MINLFATEFANRHIQEIIHQLEAALHDEFLFDKLTQIVGSGLLTPIEIPFSETMLYTFTLQAQHFHHAERVGFFPREETGLKIHVSFSAETPEYLARGMDTLMNIMAMYSVNCFKFVTANSMQFLSEEQQGKQFVIYAHHNPFLPWDIIVNTIHEALTQTGLESTQQPPLNIAIHGNAFCSIRDDNDGQGQYQDAATMWKELTKKIMITRTQKGKTEDPSLRNIKKIVDSALKLKIRERYADALYYPGLQALIALTEDRSICASHHFFDETLALWYADARISARSGVAVDNTSSTLPVINVKR